MFGELEGEGKGEEMSGNVVKMEFKNKNIWFSRI